MTDIQKKLLEIYKSVKDVCDKLDVKLIACSGTLLGAVRHQGFIPWDDDMDFYMLREDFDKFSNFAPTMINNRYLVQTNKTDKWWYNPIIKIRDKTTTAIETGCKNARYHQGLFIDIFPLDKQISDKTLLTKDEKIRKRLLYRLSYYSTRRSRKTIKSQIHKLVSFLQYPSIKNAYVKVNKLATKYNDKEAKYLGCIWDNKTKDTNCLLFERSLFSKFKYVIFEDTEVLISESYNELLRIQYGNWETPIIGTSGHTFEYVNLKEPYTKFVGK